jgi:hypothetical protein
MEQPLPFVPIANDCLGDETVDGVAGSATWTRIPSERIVGDLFEKIMQGWISEEHELTNATRLEPMTTCCARLRGDTFVYLSVSAPVDFSYRLAGAVLGRPARREEASDAFREMVNLFCGHFQTEFWSGARRCRPFLPMDIQGRDWPQREPDRIASRWALGFPVIFKIWCETMSAGQRQDHEW